MRLRFKGGWRDEDRGRVGVFDRLRWIDGGCEELIGGCGLMTVEGQPVSLGLGLDDRVWLELSRLIRGRDGRMDGLR